MKSPYPRHAEAERAVLGAILTIGSVPDLVRDKLPSPSAFYEQRDKDIYEAALSLVDAGRAVDMVTLGDWFESRGLQREPAYWAELLDATPSTARVGLHAQIVADRALRRAIVRAAEACIREAGYGTGDAIEVAEMCESLILDATFGMRTEESQPAEIVGQIVPRVWDAAITAREVGQSPGLPTGYHDLDELLGGGVDPGDLVIVAGRPSMGKTSFVTGIADSVSARGGAVLLCSLEMRREQIVARMMASRASVNLGAMRRGWLSDADMNRLAEAHKCLSSAKLYIDDKGAMTLGGVRTAARRIRSRANHLDLLIVDYLQIMGTSAAGRNDTREREVARLSAGLKGLAKELGVPVIALSQLNRSLESRQDKRPILADLRDSGSIEQDADTVIFVYRDEVYNPETPDRGLAEILVRKQRNGAVGAVKLGFISEFTKFTSLTRRGDANA